MKIKQHDNEFKDVIRSLELLRTIKADTAFRAHMEKKLTPAKPYAMPFFAIRIALIVFLVLSGSTGMIAAASDSKPGEVLYPVKQMVDSVKTTFISPAEITVAPTPLKKQPDQKTPAKQIQHVTPTPTTTVEKTQQIIIPDKPEPIITPTSTPTPTPISAQTDVLPATHTTVHQGLPIVPVLGGAQQPTPTPQPTHEGSKDNGSNAGAGGSLLPKIKIGL